MTEGRKQELYQLGYPLLKQSERVRVQTFKGKFFWSIQYYAYGLHSESHTYRADTLAEAMSRIGMYLRASDKRLRSVGLRDVMNERIR